MMSPYSENSNTSPSEILPQEFTKLPLKLSKPTAMPPASPFLMPAEFYKNLFASAVLHANSGSRSDAATQHLQYNASHQQQQQQLSHSSKHIDEDTRHFKFPHQTPVAADVGSNSFSRNFLLSSSLVANAAAVAATISAAEDATETTKKFLHCNEKKKPTTNYIWSTVNSESETNNNNSIEPTSTTTLNQIPINGTPLTGSAATPPTPPPDTQLNLEQTTKSVYHNPHNSLKTIADSGQLIQIANHEDEEEEDASETILNENSRRGVVSTTSAHHLTHKSTNKSKHLAQAAANTEHGQHHHPLSNHHSHHHHQHHSTHHGSNNSSTMPIGGVQGQNPTQGLVHWMSAVMAEHMTGQTHHDPTAVGMHYMWNGNVDHNKEIGDHNFWPPTPPTTATATCHHSIDMKPSFQTKMNDHHNNLQKGHFIDDNRLDHHAVTPQGGSVLGSSGAGHHGNHVGHHSSAASALLVVPQPINATKIGASLGGGTTGTGRKYQCKMCPQ
ncbi:zinc finger protein rotund-like, partial [Musca vetustissima]|uniref:zinc finger protein rotund-like n=1 Tax=Musca vetustissima TaxID=27455 RepID=UPI002AB72321